MVSRLSARVHALLDRVLPRARRPHHATSAGDGSAWTRPWPGSGPDDPDDGRARHVPVLVVGEVPPDSSGSVVEGTIEDDEAPADGGAPPAAGPPAAGPPADGPPADGPPAAGPPLLGPGGGGPAEPGPDAPPPAGRRLREAAVPAALLAVLVLVTGTGLYFQRPVADWLTRQSVHAVAGGFAGAWTGDRLDRLTFDPASAVRPADPQDAGERARLVAASVAAQTAGLTAAARDVPQRVELFGDVRLAPRVRGADRTATQQARVHWRLDDGEAWSYPTTIELRQRGSRWRVVWTPALVHPALPAGSGLVAERTQPPRAPILDADGRPLVRPRQVHRVNFRTDRLIMPYGDLGRLADLLELDRDRLVDRVRAAGRGSTVEVARLRDGRWQQVGARVSAVDGTSVTSQWLPVAATPSYAHALLGDVLPATRPMSRASGGTIRTGDLVGVTGLQRRYDAGLRGRSGQRVVAAPLSAGQREPRSVPAAEPGGGPVTDPLGPVLDVVSEPRPGTPLRLTLDARVQAAAQAAVDQVGLPASLVAVDVRTGAVRAVAGNLDEEWDRPLLGTYPPGSTFKVVTTWALTGRGATAAEPLPCPAAVVVDGNPFRNADGRAGGRQPLARQFARSCNTAFAGLGSRVPDTDLAAAARDLGIGVDAPSLGTASSAGRVPPAQTPAQHAAALIGQGTVTVSPLSVAVATSTVAAGRYRSPTLVLDRGASRPVVGPALDRTRLATMRALMCETVRSGTATGLQAAPGGPVAGKTGTAQFGRPRPTGAHAWFTGYQGDLAFAVVVERGGAGAARAVPVALSFLRGVNGDVRARPAASCGAATAALR